MTNYDRDPRYTPPLEDAAGGIDIRADAVWRRERYQQMAIQFLGRANEARTEARQILGARAWELYRYADDQMRRYEEAHARSVEWGKRC